MRKKGVGILIVLALLVAVVGCSNNVLEKSIEEKVSIEGEISVGEEVSTEEDTSTVNQEKEEVADASDIKLVLYPQTGMDEYVTNISYGIKIPRNYILHEMQAYYPDEPSDWKVSKEYPETALSQNLDLFEGNVFPMSLTLEDKESGDFYEYHFAQNEQYLGKGWDSAVAYEEFEIDGRVYYGTNWTMAGPDYDQQYTHYEGYNETVVYYQIQDEWCIYVRQYSKIEPALESIVHNYHENLTNA